MKKVGIISLGCDKNRVDTEKMMALIRGGGYTITSNALEAEIIIINTCSFINAARKESIDTILEFAAYKARNCQKLIVTGCLPQRHLSELKDELPEVDAFLGTGNYSDIMSVIDKLYEGERINCIDYNIKDSTMSDRVLSTPGHYAYLKIAEGCDNYCTYCTIPYIRGKYRSFDLDSLVSETKKLSGLGVKELILVAQDITRYGFDTNGGTNLCELIDRISQIDGIEWIRLLYCYPETVSDDLLKVIAQNDKVCKYIDIPMQHSEDNILKRMNRRIDRRKTDELLQKIKSITPKIAVRSTFIVGFPGETEQDFENLCRFLQEYRLDNAGFFAYSKETGTPAAKMSDQVPQKEKLRRLKIIRELQRTISAQNNKEYINKQLKVICDGYNDQKKLYIGRSQYSAPDIDGMVYFRADGATRGQFYNVNITSSSDYDVTGVTLK